MDTRGDKSQEGRDELWERYLSTSRILHRQRSKAKNYIQSMMILAMTMGHTVGRPVMRMGGGTINPMEQLCQLPSEKPLDRKVNSTNPHCLS